MNHAPTPWGFEASGKPGGNGDLNYYIVDKDKRKIAAVWGKRGEKEATAAMMIAAPEMFKALAQISKQKKNKELNVDEAEVANFEEAYDAIIDVARAAMEEAIDK